MLDSKEIGSLYAKRAGRLHHEKHGAAETFMLYACAYDKLQCCIGEKLLKAEALLDLSRNAPEASMARPPVLSNLPPTNAY